MDSPGELEAKLPALHALRRAKEEGLVRAAGVSSHSREVLFFLDGVRELGYVEGQNLVVERRQYEGNIARLPELASELVRLVEAPRVADFAMSKQIPAISLMKQGAIERERKPLRRGR